MLALSLLAFQPVHRAGAAGSPEITAAEVREHVKYLASDALEGRGSGTPGGKQAARYIADNFRAAGLRPMGAKGSYFQPFTFVAGVQLGAHNTLTLQRGDEKRSLKLKEEFMPLGLAASERVAAPIVFVGYGISAPELQHDDYAGIDVRGKVVLALRFSPGGSDENNKYSQFATFRSKATTARDKGAAGILFVTGPLDEEPEDIGVFRVDASFSDGGLPAAVIRRDLVEGLFRDAGRDLKSVQTSLAHGVASSFPLPRATAALTTSIDRERRVTENVVGFLEGADPRLKQEVLVIGAHYDHLGHGGEGSLAPGSHEIHHGADDNASGTAGVMELAQYFAAHRERLARSVMFIAFSGEEMGLLGSAYYVKHPPVPLERTVAMINMDMIGRAKDDSAAIIGTGTSPAWKELLDAVDQHTTFKLKRNDEGFGASDQSSFYARQIPVLFFFTGVHADYHRPSDTWDKINAETEARLLAVVADVAQRVAALPTRPAYARASGEPSMPTVSFHVYLGTVPDYSEEREGVTLSGVRENSPAEKAGLRAGDVIVEFDGKKIRNVYDYTYALRDAQPGKAVTLVVLRAGKRETLTVIPARPPS